jgi:hypothetical protein
VGVTVDGAGALALKRMPALSREADDLDRRDQAFLEVADDIG